MVTHIFCMFGLFLSQMTYTSKARGHAGSKRLFKQSKHSSWSKQNSKLVWKYGPNLSDE